MLLKDCPMAEEKNIDTLADFFKEELEIKRQSDYFNELADEMASRDEATLREDYDTDGFKAGMDNFFKLMKALIDEHKNEELARAAADEKYRDELIKKYNISMDLPAWLQEE